MKRNLSKCLACGSLSLALALWMTPCSGLAAFAGESAGASTAQSSASAGAAEDAFPQLSLRGLAPRALLSSSVHVTVSCPTAGSSTSSIAVSDDSDNYKTYVYWATEPASASAFTGTFAAGTTYYATIMLQAADDYEFAEGTKVAVNDAVYNASWISQGDARWIQVKDIPFSVQKPTEKISTASVTLDVPTAGAQAHPAKVSEDSEKYTASAYWTTAPNADVFKDTFAAGSTYYAMIFLIAETGYEFAEGTKVSINGVDHTASWVAQGHTTSIQVANIPFTAVVKNYKITVSGGKAWLGDKAVSAVPAGSIITLKADESPAGRVFSEWVMSGAEVADPKSTETSFLMPAGDVQAIAVFEKHVHADTLESNDEKHWWICKDCKQVEEEPHTFPAQWQSDASKHWRLCSVCGHKLEAAHTPGEWIIDKEATETVEGSKHRECTACKLKLESTAIPKHKHEFGTQWSGGEETHWKACTACGEKTQEGSHASEKWIVDKAATATQAGVLHKECGICKSVFAVTQTPALGQQISDSKGNSYKVSSASASGFTASFNKPGKGLGSAFTVPSSVTVNGVAYKVSSIAAKAFKGNKKLKSINVGSSVSSIGTEAFRGCTGLATAVIGKRVKTIGARAFYGCAKLKRLTIKSTKLASIGSNALKGTHTRISIVVPQSKITKYSKLFKGKGQRQKL